MITALNNTGVSSDLFVNRNQNLTQFTSTQIAQPKSDVVNISRPDLMTDEEAQEVMSDVQNTIGDSPLEAMSVHQGLDLSRVMALLEDI